VGNGGTGATLGTGTVSDNGVLVFNHNDTVTQSVTISGSGSLIQSGGAGASVLVLAASNLFTGGTSVLGGTLSISADNNLGAIPASPTTNLILGTNLLATSSFALNANRLITSVGNGGQVDATAGNVFTIGGIISGSVGLTKTSNASTVILLGANSYTTTRISGGTLQVGNGGAGAKLGSGTVLDNGTLVYNHSDSLTQGTQISGSGSVVQTGTGTLILTASNSHTGGTSATGGVLSISADANLGTAPGSPATNITLNGGELLATTSVALNVNRQIAIPGGGSGGTLDASAGLTLTVNGAISGAGQLSKGANAGTVILMGGNSYNMTSIVGGTLQVGNGGAGATLGTGTIMNSAALVFNHNDSLTVSAVISGGGSITQSGAGTLILNGSNSYTGGTLVAGGTLSASTINGLGTNTVTFNASSFQFEPSAGFDLSARTIAINAGGATFDTNGNTVSFANAIGNGGAGAFIKVGTGTLTFTKSNTYTGGTTVRGGTLVTNANFTNGPLAITTGKAQVTTEATSNTLAGATDVTSVSVTGNGVLDLTNNALIVDYTPGNSPLTTIAGDIKTAFNGGSWNGVGITSSSAAAIAISTNIHKTALGFGEASALGIGSFAGHTVDTTTVVVGYTLSGDANLDGQVNMVDFNKLAANFGKTGQSWVNGDDNYDGTVNLLDLNSIATNYGAAFSSPPVDSEPVAGLGALVPEPGMLMMAPLITIVCRRRRRQA
jgi:autotransporter-associated beta strand protein